jgi:hypothetical protein
MLLFLHCDLVSLRHSLRRDEEPSHDLILTNWWIALKHSSKFVDSTGHEFQDPCAGYVLRTGESSPMFSSAEAHPISAIFIRACYIKWFNHFLHSAKQKPTGKFALSSSPGCGKTFAINFIFKMAYAHPFLRDKAILYQFQEEFFHIQSDKVFDVDRAKAYGIAMRPNTFYVLDGFGARPVYSECLTLFISSPRHDYFKHWYYHAMILPSYFPVWSLEELRDCRALCYPTIDPATVDDRYRKYGGNPHCVFWPGEPPSIEGVVANRDARKSIHAVGEPSRMLPLPHMLLHLSVDEKNAFSARRSCLAIHWRSPLFRVLSDYCVRSTRRCTNCSEL